jgi:hypothetical protein
MQEIHQGRVRPPGIEQDRGGAQSLDLAIPRGGGLARLTGLTSRGTGRRLAGCRSRGRRSARGSGNRPWSAACRGRGNPGTCRPTRSARPAPCPGDRSDQGTAHHHDPAERQGALPGPGDVPAPARAAECARGAERSRAPGRQGRGYGLRIASVQAAAGADEASDQALRP